MKKISKYIVLLCVFCMLMPQLSALAEDDAPLAYETALLDKINEARENPLAVAASLGMDTETLLEQLPGLRHILENGLLPVNFNSDIYQAARSHVEEMVSSRYYDYTSLNGDSANDRIADTGYNVAVSDEILGMLGFMNYIPPEEAADRIFENMFTNELDPANTENRVILNPAYKDAGAAIDTGVFQIGASRVNVYVAACDFAAKPMWILENEYIALINQARANPLKMAKKIGLDADKILNNNKDIQDILQDGVPPVIFNRYLYESAVAHGRDMLKNAYFSRISEDGRRVADRIDDTGYLATDADEVIGSIFAASTVSLKSMAYQIFTTKYKAELQRKEGDPLVLLNPDYTDAGLSLTATYVENDQITDISKYLIMVVDFAAPEETPSSTLWAMVYDDKDENGIYSPGEGYDNAAVEVHGNGMNLKVTTDFVGRLVIPLPAGTYRVQAVSADNATVLARFLN